MQQRTTIYRDFENFVADLFERYGVTIIRESQHGRSYDLKVRSNTNIVAIVEIKFYQSLKIASDILRRTLNQITVAMSRTNITHG